ncbi:MAG TPA: hypothetical protein VGF93_09825 [Solirubrobacteraceae bacterium]
MSARSYRLWGHTRVIDRAVYGTIVVTSVLAVYDGWGNLRLLDAAAIILGPVVAMVIGHIFAATLAVYPAVGRRPMRSELLTIMRHESHFLLVCAPQLILLLVLSAVGLSMSDTVSVLIWAGAASLGFWGGLAAQRAGLRSRDHIPVIALEVFGEAPAMIAVAERLVEIDGASRARLEPVSDEGRSAVSPDLLPIAVAFAAGVAGMLAFETRASSGVGVAIARSR